MSEATFSVVLRCWWSRCASRLRRRVWRSGRGHGQRGDSSRLDLRAVEAKPRRSPRRMAAWVRLNPAALRTVRAAEAQGSEARSPGRAVHFGGRCTGGMESTRSDLQTAGDAVRQPLRRGEQHAPMPRRVRVVLDDIRRNHSVDPDRTRNMPLACGDDRKSFGSRWPRRGSNPHSTFVEPDFKSDASACFATRPKWWSGRDANA